MLALWPAALLLAGCAAGCAGDPATTPQRVVHDLAAEFMAAEVAWEPGSYDFGTPTARAALVEGFSRNEGDEERTWVWSLGDGAALELFLITPRDLILEFTVQPFSAPGMPPQVLQFTSQRSGADVSRQAPVPLGSLELRPGVHVYRLPVDASALHTGANRIGVRHAWSRVPAAVTASRDRRPLAVAWQSLRVLEANGRPLADGDEDEDRDRDTALRPGAPPRAAPEAKIHLPAGSRVDFYLALPSRATWVVDRVRTRDGAVLRLDLLRSGGASERTVYRGGAQEGLEVPLGAEAGLARLRLTVSAGSGGVTLEGPRVVAAEVEATGSTGSPDAESARAADANATTDRAAATDTAGERESAEVGARRSSEHPTTSRPPDVILYVIDTLRADALGAYGATDGATPRLDAFAAEAVLFERARAQSSWTQPSVASLFTGLGPAAHGVVSGETRLPEDLPSLPALLRNAGYRTAAIVANGYISEDFGFARGFDHFRMLPDLHTRAGAVQAAALEWLDASADDDRPFFLYIHTIDPHAPYEPLPPMAERFAPGIDPTLGTVERMAALADRKEVPADPATTAERLQALYTGDVAWQDREIGRFFELLAERGLYEDAALLVVSDHGEEFAEHGRWTHGLNLHRETVDVPLLLRLPGGEAAGTRVASLVQHTDVPSTLLALAGLEPAVLAPVPGPAAERRDLRRMVRRGVGPSPQKVAADAGEAGIPSGRPVFSHLNRYSTAGASVEWGRWKLILPLSRALGDRPRLYDRLTDPTEARDLALDHPVLTGWLATQIRHELIAARQRETPTPRAKVDEETRERLRALGYLQ